MISMPLIKDLLYSETPSWLVSRPWSLSLLMLAVVLGGGTISCEASEPAPSTKRVSAQVKDCEDCPPMVRLPVASPDGAILFVAQHELTWAEYLQAVKEDLCALPRLPNGVSYPQDLTPLSDDYPIVNLPPTEFTCYLNWISKKTGYKYRLPTGQEWELAARAGARGRFPWGDQAGFGNAAVATWFDPTSVKGGALSVADVRSSIGLDKSFFKVESFGPNAWGLFDVIGNVAEYTSDTRPAQGTCVRKFSSSFCTLFPSRGGGVSSVRLKLNGEIVGNDKEFFLDRTYWFGGAVQHVGFRVVRGDGE